MKWVGDHFEPQLFDKVLHRIGVGFKVCGILALASGWLCSLGWLTYIIFQTFGIWTGLVPVSITALGVIGHWMVKKGYWKEVDF